MQSLWLLTKKNIKLLLRAKSSALIVFLAPLLTILILGLSYSTSSQYGINVGIYAPAYTDDVNAFMESLQQQDFKVVKYTSTLEECIEDIKVSAIHTCISLPESFMVEGNTPKEVTFYIDPSRINLVWMIQETVKNEFNLKSQEISQSLAQDVLTKLSDAKIQIGERRNEAGAIKEKSSSAASSVSSAQSSLQSIDVTAPESSYDLTILNTTSVDIREALDSIIAAVGTVEDANMSDSDKSNIIFSLEGAQEKLDGVLIAVNGTGAGTLPALLLALQNDVDVAKAKLTAAGEAISSSSSTISSAGTTLQEMVTALDALQTSLSSVQANLESQRVTDPATLTNPLVTRVEKVSKEGTFLNYTFPTLLVLVIMFTSLLLGTILVMMEKNSSAFLRNFFLPLKKTTFIISTYLTNLLFIIVQIIIILGISLFFLEDLLPVLPAIALVLFIAASIFTFLGMAIGYLFTSEETGVLASISMGSLLLFISGVVLPIETISPWLREVTSFNPFVIAEKLIRELFIFQSSLLDVGVELLILVGYAVALFIIILIIESLLHQHLVHKFMKIHHKANLQREQRNKGEW